MRDRVAARTPEIERPWPPRRVRRETGYKAPPSQACCCPYSCRVPESLILGFQQKQMFALQQKPALVRSVPEIVRLGCICDPDREAARRC